jgi:voltage-gated potassium channel
MIWFVHPGAADACRWQTPVDLLPTDGLRGKIMSNTNQANAQTLNPPAHGYSVLFAALMGLWILAPFARAAGLGDAVELVLLTILMLAAGYATSDQGKRFKVIVVLGILMGLLIWINFTPWIDIYPYLPSKIVGIAFFVLVAYELLVDILAKQGRVDMSLIYGALSVYLLIGIAFAWLYEAIYVIDPGAFKGVEIDPLGELGEFQYFSFVTLTTLGYGDISPTTRIAGSFATLEAIIGQVYLTVLVARLVGMQISQPSQE